MSIGVNQFASAIADQLLAYSQATNEAVAEAINLTAEKAGAIVQASAKHFGSNYAGDIKVRKGHLTTGPNGAKVTAYVTAGDHYRVAHLLEHGHAIVSGGRTVGQVEGYPHFAKGQDYIDNNLVDNLRRVMDSES